MFILFCEKPRKSAWTRLLTGPHKGSVTFQAMMRRAAAPRRLFGVSSYLQYMSEVDVHTLLDNVLLMMVVVVMSRSCGPKMHRGNRSGWLDVLCMYTGTIHAAVHPHPLRDGTLA
jgi:hypothetical protein